MYSVVWKVKVKIIIWLWWKQNESNFPLAPFPLAHCNSLQQVFLWNAEEFPQDIIKVRFSSNYFAFFIWLNCAMIYFSRWHQSTNFKLWWHRPPMQLQQYRLFHTALVHCRAWSYYVKSYCRTFLWTATFTTLNPNLFTFFDWLLMGESTDCSLWYPCYL